MSLTGAVGQTPFPKRVKVEVGGDTGQRAPDGILAPFSAACVVTARGTEGRKEAHVSSLRVA